VTETVSTSAQQRLDGRKRWFQDQGLQLLVVVISLTTTACYLIGRAGLLGWYGASGVPVLALSWPAQDVVIKGISDASTLLIIAVAALAVCAYFFLLEVTSGRLNRYVTKWLRLRQRGEPCDRVALRRRWAEAARSSALRKTDDAVEWRARWRVLGKRGRFRRPTAIRPSRSGQLSPVAASALIAALCLIVLSCSYILGAIFLYVQPYNAGARSFRAEYVAATGRPPPVLVVDADGTVTNTGEVSTILPSEVEGGRQRLLAYPYVEVTGDFGGPQKPAVLCGWLVEGTGNQLLLLTRAGLFWQNFGDQPFSWKRRPAGMCSPHGAPSAVQ
jgi:hypothetical protein